MSRRKWVLVVSAVALVSAALWAYGLAAGYTLPWWTVGSRGGSSGGEYAVCATIGQPAGSMGGGGYRLTSGFCSSGVSTGTRLYIPLVTR